jgi:hypothetical protein
VLAHRPTVVAGGGGTGCRGGSCLVGGRGGGGRQTIGHRRVSGAKWEVVAVGELGKTSPGGQGGEQARSRWGWRRRVSLALLRR